MKQEPILFDSQFTARMWLNNTDNYGRIHAVHGGFIILQFTDGNVWAFTAPDSLQLLADW